MLWSKVGGSILREVDDSRLLLWFVGSKVHKVICGNCWHLLTPEEKEKHFSGLHFQKQNQKSLNSSYLKEVRILVLRGLLGSLAVCDLSSFSSFLRSFIRCVEISQHEGIERQGRDGVDLCVVPASIAASHNGVFCCAARHTDGPGQMPPGSAFTCLHIPHHGNLPSNTLHQVSEDGLKYRRAFNDLLLLNK